MMAKVASIVKKLKSARNWLKDQQGGEKTQDGIYRTNQIICGCVALLCQSITSYRAWLSRKNRLQLICGGHRKYTSKKNNRAIRQLIDLTISDIEANEPFNPELSMPVHLEGFGRKQLVCHKCGETFFANRSDAKHCSGTCRNKAAKENRDVTDKPTVDIKSRAA